MQKAKDNLQGLLDLEEHPPGWTTSLEQAMAEGTKAKAACAKWTKMGNSILKSTAPPKAKASAAPAGE